MKVFLASIALACGVLSANMVRADYIPAEKTSGPPAGATSVRLQRGTVKVSAGALTTTRSFLYYIPSSFNAAAGTVVFLHGGTGDGLDAARGESDYQFTAMAENHGAIVIFPDGFKIVNPDYDPKNTDVNDKHSYYFSVMTIGTSDKPQMLSYVANGKAASEIRYARSWNNCSSSPSLDTAPPGYPDGSTSDGSAQFALDHDDVSFIRAIQKWTQSGALGKQTPVANRFYVAGHSEGSKMAERLALEANDVVTAIAVAAGNVPKGDDTGVQKCKGYDAAWAGTTLDPKVPVMLIKGDMDPRIPFSSTSFTYPLSTPAQVNPPSYTEGGRMDVPPDQKDVCQVNGGTEDPYNGGAEEPANCATGLQYNYTKSLGFWQRKLGISGVDADLNPADPNSSSESTFSFVKYPDDIPCYTPPAPSSGSTQDKPPAYGTTDYYNACFASSGDAAKDLADNDGSFVYEYTYGPAVTVANQKIPTHKLVFMHVYGGGHCFPGVYAQNSAGFVCGSGFKNRDTLKLSSASGPSYMGEKIWQFFNAFNNENRN